MKWVDGRTVKFLTRIVVQAERELGYNQNMNNPFGHRTAEIETEIKHLERRLENVKKEEERVMLLQKDVQNAKAFLRNFNERSCIKV